MSAPISAIERLDVFVARTPLVCSRSSAKTCFFVSSSSNTASSTRSQPSNCSQPVPPSTIVARNGFLTPTSARIVARASSTRAWSMSRSTTGTSSRRRKSVASCVAISPAPTIPTFCTLRGCASGSSGGRFDRRSTTVNAYADACACGLTSRSTIACSSAA